METMHYEGEIDKESATIMLNESTIMQGFVPLAGELSTISFYIYNEELTEEEKEAKLVFRLFDANLQKLEEKSYPVRKLQIPGECHIRIGSDFMGRISLKGHTSATEIAISKNIMNCTARFSDMLVLNCSSSL